MANYRASRMRRNLARFFRHNGNTDVHGNPTISVDNDWEELPVQFPCEVYNASGGEKVRGRQVTHSTTNVLFGEFYSVTGVKPTDRVRLGDGREFEVVHVADQDGARREARIEVKAEV